MEIEYKISEKDYIYAAKLASHATKKQLYGLFFVGLILLFLAVFGGHKIQFISIIGIIGGILGYFITVFIIGPFQAKRNYRKYKRIQEPLNFALQNDGYRIWNAGGESNVKWSDLLRWRENKEYILLYFAPRLYHLLPKSLADSGLDITDLIAKLENQVGPAT